MNREYGCEVCPITDELVNKYGTDEGICYDYDRLGIIACGLCGANKERSEEGQNNFYEGLARQINNK